MATFGVLLRDVRGKSGKTLGQVAEHLGVSIPYLSDVERGNRPPLVTARILKLATFLGTDPAPLLIAASKPGGVIDLDLGRSPKHQQAGATLVRGWANLAPKDLDAIMRIVQAAIGAAG